MKLTDEYQAAVNLGYVSQKQAERIMMDNLGIDSENELQRKSFFAGYLWANFLYGWHITDSDKGAAHIAWETYCEHIETKERMK